MFKKDKNLFLNKEGIATKKPIIIEIIIDVIEIKRVVVNPVNKNFKFVRPFTL